MNNGKLQCKVDWAEGRALLRSNPSADPGAKTEARAVGTKCSAARLPLRDWRQSDKPSRHDVVTRRQDAAMQFANGERDQFQFTVNQDNVLSNRSDLESLTRQDTLIY